MTDTILRIATRKSPLALWQSEHVAARLRAGPVDQRAQIAAIRVERVHRYPPLDLQMGEEGVDVGVHRRAQTAAKRRIAAANASPIMRRNSVPMPG
mgnify:CR=1 FL=1